MKTFSFNERILRNIIKFQYTAEVLVQVNLKCHWFHTMPLVEKKISLVIILNNISEKKSFKQFHSLAKWHISIAFVDYVIFHH